MFCSILLLQGTLRDLFTVESEPTNVQSTVSKAASNDEMETVEESQEEPERSSETAEVSGAKTEGGNMTQNLLEQVQHFSFQKGIFENFLFESAVYCMGNYIAVVWTGTLKGILKDRHKFFVNIHPCVKLFDTYNTN